jgi:hypothetical protein
VSARKLKADLPYGPPPSRGPPSRGISDCTLNSRGLGAKFREQGLSAEQKHPDWEEQVTRLQLTMTTIGTAPHA